MDKNTELTIRFPNKALLKDFATWLCDQGEQNYFMWAEVQGHDAPINRFKYHTKNPKFNRRDARRYGPFIADNLIIADNSD